MPAVTITDCDFDQPYDEVIQCLKTRIQQIERSLEQQDEQFTQIDKRTREFCESMKTDIQEVLATQCSG